MLVDEFEGDLKFRYDGFAKNKVLGRFSKSKARVQCLMGPFGSGKTTACLMKLISVGAQQHPSPRDGIRRSKFAVVRNTYMQLRDTTIASVLQCLPPAQFGTYNKTDHTYLITGIDGLEVELLFRALDREDQIGNLLSLELTGAWLNEAREIPKGIYTTLNGRIPRFPPKALGGAVDPCLIMDTNPPEEGSWLWRLCEEERPPSHLFQLFRQPPAVMAKPTPDGRYSLVKVNPHAENVANLDDGYYENLFHLNSYDPSWIKVYLLSEYGFVVDGDPVYRDYSDLVHYHEDEIKPVEGWPVYRGWDFGLTPACVFAQLEPTPRFIVFDEMTSENMDIDRFSDEVLEYCARKYPGIQFVDYGDPAGVARSEVDLRSCFDVMHAKGIEIEPSEVSLRIRLEAVKRALRRMERGFPYFVLGPRCQMLRKGFLGGYQYPKRKEDPQEKLPKAEPVKNVYSHPMNALEYILARLIATDLTQRPRRSGQRTAPNVRVA